MMDRSSHGVLTGQRLGAYEVQMPLGAGGEIVFAGVEKPLAFIYRIKEDGTRLQKVNQTPTLLPFSVSPDGRSIPAAEGPSPETRDALMVYPIDGGAPTPICRCYPAPDIENGPMPPQMSWTPDGKFLYLKYEHTLFAIPLQPGRLLPTRPPSGFPSKEAVVFPGPNPSIYATMKVSTQRNIYRVPVQ
jgi:hypothetical protein